MMVHSISQAKIIQVAKVWKSLNIQLYDECQNNMSPLGEGEAFAVKHFPSKIRNSQESLSSTEASYFFVRTVNWGEGKSKRAEPGENRNESTRGPPRSPYFSFFVFFAFPH